MCHDEAYLELGGLPVVLAQHESVNSFPAWLMTAAPEADSGIVSVAPFAWFVQRFDELIASSNTMVVYFIHSRRWRENHDTAIKAFLSRDQTTLEAFVPDLENHELMFSLSKHFDDGPQIPSLVVDAYRYFGGWPESSASRRGCGCLPALEIRAGSLLGNFLATDIEDLKRECRQRAVEELEAVISKATDSLT